MYGVTSVGREGSERRRSLESLVSGAADGLLPKFHKSRGEVRQAVRSLRAKRLFLFKKKRGWVENDLL